MTPDINGGSRDCQKDTIGPVRRAIAILRLLAAAGRRGYPLTELAKRSGLPHPTVHRILKQLIAERVAYQSNITGRYGLGELTHELGLAAAEQHDLERLCRPELARLAESVGDTVYLVTRAGSDALCVDRFEGPRVFTFCLHTNCSKRVNDQDESI